MHTGQFQGDAPLIVAHEVLTPIFRSFAGEDNTSCQHNIAESFLQMLRKKIICLLTFVAGCKQQRPAQDVTETNVRLNSRRLIKQLDGDIFSSAQLLTSETEISFLPPRCRRRIIESIFLISHQLI